MASLNIDYRLVPYDEVEYGVFTNDGPPNGTLGMRLNGVVDTFSGTWGYTADKARYFDAPYLLMALRFAFVTRRGGDDVIDTAISVLGVFGLKLIAALVTTLMLLWVVALISMLLTDLTSSDDIPVKRMSIFKRVNRLLRRFELQSVKLRWSVADKPTLAMFGLLLATFAGMFQSGIVARLMVKPKGGDKDTTLRRY